MDDPELPFLVRLARRSPRVVVATSRHRPRLQLLLSSWGCEFVLVPTPRRVLEEHAGRPADAVVVDLPAAARRKIVAALAGSPNRPRLIALVSGRREAELALAAGYDDALVEPLSLLELEGVFLALAADLADRPPVAG